MNEDFLVVVNAKWARCDRANAKRLSQGLCALGTRAGALADGCRLLIKFRDPSGQIVLDDESTIRDVDHHYFIKSTVLAARLQNSGLSDDFILYYFEGAPAESRCIITTCSGAGLSNIERDEPSLRFAAFDLPPASATVVDSQPLLHFLYHKISSEDEEIFSVQASRFLEAPHILSALLGHVFSMGAEENVRFPIQVKKLAEQLRIMLQKPDSSVRIGRMTRSHLELWSDVEGQRFGFLDGGVARIPAVANLEPMALRVGVYSVLPGVEDPEVREQWRMRPFILGDLVDHKRPTDERPDPRKFLEAARYTLEPLMGLEHVKEFPDTRILSLHGPLVNQFVIYDEGRPNYIPFISPRFLEQFNIRESDVSASVQDLPRDASDRPMWNQFMAVYAYVMRAVDTCQIPIVGVVERPVGRAVTTAVLARLKEDRIVNGAYVERFLKQIEQYDVTDDFLFGCALEEGEYISPVQIQKNPVHKAWGRWHPVVRQYPQPSALLLKTENTNFPFRVEMNKAAAKEAAFVSRFLYHTARLLPRYAFPVGLDIVDKYAKIPDWVSRSVSGELSASILRRALKTGDAHLVSQIRLFLAKGPRDFFFRPKSAG